MKEWIFVLAEKDKDALGSIRTMPGMLAARNGATIWLRGLNTNSDVTVSIKQLPLIATYLLDAENRLFLQDASTPQQVLPALNWIEISKFIQVEVPTSAMPGKTDEKTAIRLVKSQETRQGEALLTQLTTLKQYAETAPASRLNAIKFVVSDEGNALIIGTPLPSMPGREYWNNKGILLPCGYDFELSITAQLFSQTINPAGFFQIVFEPNGQWQKISSENFVRGTRSAIRLTTLPQLV